MNADFMKSAKLEKFWAFSVMQKTFLKKIRYLPLYQKNDLSQHSDVTTNPQPKIPRLAEQSPIKLKFQPVTVLRLL